MKEFIKNIEIEAVNEINKQEGKMNNMEYRKIHAERLYNGKFVYIVESNLNTMYELSEFEHCFICANNVGGRVRFTITEKTDVSTLLWNYAKINMAFQFPDVSFIVDYNSPDWDGAEEFIMRKFHDCFDIYVSGGEYPGCPGEILVYNKKPWTENGYGFKFSRGEKTPREIVNFLYRRMYRW